ncbi:MAG: SpoIID/LytB domain-containing protein [Candidatus Melainabacteria bacterium]|nr:SpoIID/LytB domain-containing protein [Candidatus Melainabacteria bacterium]
MTKSVSQLLLVLAVVLLSLTISPASAFEIKIGLATTDQEIIVSSTEESIFIDLANNQIISKLDKNKKCKLSKSDGLISISNTNNNHKIGKFTGPIQLIPINKNGLVVLNDKFYRGYFTVQNSYNNKGVTIINNINIEDYLLSVVPSEMPNGWHKEALKAQTIAARTYALGFLGRRKNKGYDLEATVEDQVYLGVSSEKPSTNQAVVETDGEILVDKFNNPIIALFHSSGGGYTDSIENIWDKKDIKPSIHIQPRPDFDDNSPYFEWERTISLKSISEKVQHLEIGEVSEIIPLEKSISNRIKKFKLIGTRGNKKINGDNFRRLLKLPSAKFNFTKNDGEEIRFIGRGFGHGLGLSQWGTKALAENGFSYKHILAHYYPETMLSTIKNSNIKGD